MSDSKPEAPASHNEPWHGIHDSEGPSLMHLGHTHEVTASRDSFDLTGEVQAEPSRRIAALEAALAHERELRQAAEREVQRLKSDWEDYGKTWDEMRRVVAELRRERDYYRDGYEIALDQWEQCRDGWDAAERERNRQWDDAEVARQGLWTAKAALATLQAKHDDLVRWRRGLTDARPVEGLVYHIAMLGPTFTPHRVGAKCPECAWWAANPAHPTEAPEPRGSGV